MPQIKAVIIVLKIATCVAIISTLIYAGYTYGVNKTVSEYELKARLDREKQEREFNEQLQREIHLANYWRDRAIEYSQIIPEPDTKVVKEIVYKNPDCTVIHGVTSLYKSASDRFKLPKI